MSLSVSFNHLQKRYFLLLPYLAVPLKQDPRDMPEIYSEIWTHHLSAAIQKTFSVSHIIWHSFASTSVLTIVWQINCREVVLVSVICFSEETCWQWLCSSCCLINEMKWEANCVISVKLFCFSSKTDFFFFPYCTIWHRHKQSGRCSEKENTNKCFGYTNHHGYPFR